jgi:hypothetical protein
VVLVVDGAGVTAVVLGAGMVTAVVLGAGGAALGWALPLHAPASTHNATMEAGHRSVGIVGAR